ncbi:glycosyltransferase [candidate division KSB1 bacterium]|nr:glycosyltransferase [candidate division KSB1 bacterium]MBL7092548.1 glycosyltransferase [candidate division KSB1 bacterium]
MNILMIAPQPFFTPRGTPLSVLHRINTLSKLGHHIDLVTYHIGKTIPFENVNYYRIPKIPFIKKISVGPSKRKIIIDYFVFVKSIKLLVKNKYDVVHTHEEAGFFGYWLAKIFNTMHLYDMHSSLPQQLTNFKFTKLKILIKLFEGLEKRTIENSAALITICPELYNYVEQNYPEIKQWLIENVADNSTVFGEPEIDEKEFKNKYRLNSNTIILYAGTFEPYQGLDLLIEASKDVVKNKKDVTFLMVGGNPDQVAHYRSLVENNNLSDNFVFSGQVAPELVPRFVELADVLVTPRIEGNNTPLKIYSYLRSGKPIVATNHMTHTQVLDESVAVLTECDALSFSKGLINILNDNKLKQSIVANAKNLAKEKYSYQAYVKKTQDIYEYLEQVKISTGEKQ